MTKNKKFISISTKTGDKGQTGLANGERLAKDELIFEVLGTFDEFNSWLGLIISQMPRSHEQREYLMETQDILFQLGAVVAQSPKVKLNDTILTDLEKRSEELQKSMQENWTTQFLYPGGIQLAAQIDVARAVCRRLERLLIKHSNREKKPIPELIIKFINRFSDYLFILRCFINQQSNYQEKKFSYAQSLL